MEIEQLEIYDFLKSCHPLNKLSKQQLKEIALAIEITYFPRSQLILTPNTINHHLYLIRTGSVERTDSENGLVARFAQNDFFGYRSLERGGTIKNQVNAIEDSLFYMIPENIYFKLMQENKGFNRYFHQEKNKRLRSAIKDIHSQDHNILNNSRVLEFLNDNILTVPSTLSIKNTAKMMSEHNMTAALVMEGSIIKGIVTDRVFCTKVVAESHNPNAKITTIMTENLITISPNSTGLEAMLIMARNNIRHLPVIENDQIKGLLTATDLIHHQSHNPIYIINEIHKAPDINKLEIISQQLPMSLCKLVDAGLQAHDIAYSISSVGRAIAQRIIKLEISKLGTPPIDFAFLVAGSLARNDQTAHSDQDNGMILSNQYDETKHGEYFNNLANNISKGLNQCGYVFCPGEVMATNPKWRQPYDIWRNYFKKWIYSPEPKALMYSSIFFDLRCIYGNISLLNALHKEVHSMIKKNKMFLSFLTANALQNKPPLGLFKRFVLEKHGQEDKALNMKKRGIMPCTDIARVFALDAGIDQINTRDRFRLAYENKIISKEAKNDLIDAYDFLSIIRLKHQSEKIKQGKKANNYVKPEELSSLERRHLKDAFELIRTYQDVLSNKYTQGRI